METDNARKKPDYQINSDCLGYSEFNSETNCWNFSIISIDSKNDALQNNYLAGYVQGKLQGKDMLEAARNNSWKNAYLCDPSHTFPKELPPSKKELKDVCQTLSANYSYLLSWLDTEMKNKDAKASGMAKKILCLLYRMYGIYDGAAGKEIMAAADLLCRTKVADVRYTLAFGDEDLTFMDVYFINSQLDLFDARSMSMESADGGNNSESCSAFVKRVGDDVYWTHNSWCGYLSMSHTITYLVRNDNGNKDEKKNMDFVTQNSYCPGQFGSNMDFGFNGHAICFNETTHRYSEAKQKVYGIWLCWRAAAAEIFSTSIDEFYDFISIDNTGTYLNGYMIIDAKNNDTALVEMSHKRFVLFRSGKNDQQYSVTEKDMPVNGELSSENKPLSKDDYNPDLLCKEHIFGINYPISYSVAVDLKSTDNRPKRRIQFRDQIGSVEDMETAKNLITYVDEKMVDGKTIFEPLSIYGRWDFGHGNAGGYAKIIPDGAIDAKAYSASKVRALLDSLDFKPNGDSKKTSFWMLYGAPIMDGKPFVWSKSQWKKYKEENDFVPDELTGKWHEVKLFID